MKNRLNNLSIYRIIATVAILQFHVFFILYDRDIPYEMLMSKGVQGLTALSGFLYSRKKITDGRAFLLKSSKKLLPPALICIGIMAVWNLVYMLAVGGNYFSLFFDERSYNGALLIQPGNYYYLLYIFICYLLTPYLAKSKRHRVAITAVAVACELALGFFFGTSIILTTYLVGYLVGLGGYERYTDRRYRLREPLIWMLILTAAFGGYALTVSFPAPSGYILSHLHSLANNICSATFGMSTFFVIAYLAKFTNGERFFSVLKYTDSLCLSVFLLNQTFMCGAMNVAAWVDIRVAQIALVYAFTIFTAVLVNFITPKIVGLFSRKAKA